MFIVTEYAALNITCILLYVQRHFIHNSDVDQDT